MGQLIENYFKPLLNPFRFHEELAQGKRESFTLLEVILMSVIFKIVSSYYVFLSLFLSHTTAMGIEKQYPEMTFLFGLSSMVERGLIMSTLMGIVFFPLISMGYYFLLQKLIAFCCRLFGVIETGPNPTGSLEEKIHRVIVTSFSSNTMLAIPLFGGLIRFFYSGFLIYAGLRSSLGLKRDQALVVLGLPFLLMAFTIVGTILYFYILFSTILFPEFSF